MDVATIIHTFVLLVLLPAWLLVGLADWWCYRQTSIETTSGPAESLFHLLLSAEAAVAVISAMLLEINALILVVMAMAFIAHEFTTAADVRFAFDRRVLTPREQRIHDYLTAIPMAALCLTFATHLDQAAGIAGLSEAAADFKLRWKDPALPLPYVIAWFGASFALNVLPYVEEFVRGMQAWGKSFRI